jgi:tRNA nucleotidyltransferase (CCA-adding enzyme)
MGRPGHAYPQVETRAGALADLRVALAPASVSVAGALTLARRKRADALVASGRPGLVLQADIQRAVRLGLQGLDAAALARPVPVVAPRDPEIVVRRHLLAGAPAVLVMDRAAPAAISRSLVRGARTGSVLTARQLAWIGGPVLEVLTGIGRVAIAAGVRAFVVGGLVRDALRAPARPGPLGALAERDVDVVVEGDGIALAERLARELGGHARVHAAFGTASIEGLAIGRLDVATARAERYRLPGALPDVRPGTILDDLERRDFSVNAMAVELSSGTFELLDPLGGSRDLERRRLRVLHPLAFVEDPTRIFRAARYATRLGLTLDRASWRARALAVRIQRYPALSGQRLATELGRVITDHSPDRSLRRLAAAGAFRLLDPRLGFPRGSAAAIRGVEETLDWIRRRRLDADPLELGLLAILAEATPEVSEGALTRLGFSGAPRTRVLRARGEAPGLARALGTPGPRSGGAAALRGRSALELAETWRQARPRARAVLDWWVAEGTRIEPALDGADLIALGVPPGPAVGAARRRLRDARLDGIAATRDDEIGLVARWTGKGHPGDERSGAGPRAEGREAGGRERRRRKEP